MDRKLTALLAEVFNIKEAEIAPELTKNDVGNWDSLTQMEVVVSLEREYNVSLGIPDIVRMISVAAIMDVLREKGISLEN